MSSEVDVPTILADIHEDLLDDGVYVDPTLTSTVTAAQLDAIVDNVAANPVPTFVVLYPLRDGDPFSGNPQDLLARLNAAHPMDGQYFSTDKYLQYGGEGFGLDGRSYGVPGSDGEIYNDALSLLTYESQPSVGAAAERLTALLLEPPEEVAALVETARQESRSDDQSSDTGTSTGDGSRGDDGGDGGDGGLDATGMLLALVVAAVVGGVGWAAVRRRRAGRPRPTGAPTFALPPSAMDRIREAHDRRLEKEARDELLALGEAVDATEIGRRHDRGSWQAALDHYDAASRALTLGDDPEDPDVLDVVGALVLARRGRAALAAATRGRAWQPSAGCYLNPLHGDASGQARLRSTDGDDLPEQVPMCAACRTALEQGKGPDALDVVHRGTPRHYFETDVEPWAATGYGSLDPDLVTALQKTRR